ncbi:winged helix-turn-helix domain-containing protein [Pseudomarimonas arenosa]|uniref:Winged helix-turn-helix domain-containing protein n=1 Tax=Pseudomarimonas arenosa TaxID=2774145 RepID=A0AAW3ZRD6_9GAMM|nr:winged helix-turn-helix domain-containing protein [Pseudomarimonas arenosa]MBD8527667.1 winged helix-turn-helix domain-containing protein [Pseudomarimonas arenosa]
MQLDPFRLGELTVDPRRNRVQWPNGDQARITAQVMHVLCALADCNGQLLSRKELIERVWDGNHLVGDKGIATAIWALRRALRESKDAPRYIQTIPRKGFRCLAPKHPLPPQEPASTQLQADREHGILHRAFQRSDGGPRARPTKLIALAALGLAFASAGAWW